MKSIKYMSLALALLSSISLLFTACDNDDDDDVARPVITLTEVGHDNSKQAHPGHDMHLEADIVAEGIIARIDVELHKEGDGKYEIEKSYTDKYTGVRNAEFHEHIDIPADAPLGEYHLHLTVTDKQGNQTSAQCHVNLIEGDDDDDDDDHGHDHK